VQKEPLIIDVAQIESGHRKWGGRLEGFVGEEEKNLKLKGEAEAGMNQKG